MRRADWNRDGEMQWMIKKGGLGRRADAPVKEKQGRKFKTFTKVRCYGPVTNTTTASITTL
jgi:hypothetical protein